MMMMKRVTRVTTRVTTRHVLNTNSFMIFVCLSVTVRTLLQDPFVMVILDEKEVAKTKIIYKTRFPEWQETFKVYEEIFIEYLKYAYTHTTHIDINIYIYTYTYMNIHIYIYIPYI